MNTIKVYKCGRCGNTPKVQKRGKWYKIFCPVCFIGRTKFSCDDIDYVIWNWNIRAENENKTRNEHFRGIGYKNEFVSVFIDERN